MISKRISNICSQRISTCPIIAVDPNGQFVLVYSLYTRTIYLVRSINITIHCYEYLLDFAKKQNWSHCQHDLEIQPSAIIESKMLPQNITSICIGKVHEGKQYLAIGSLFEVKAFQIFTKQFSTSDQKEEKNKGQLKPQQIRYCVKSCLNLRNEQNGLPILKFHILFNILSVSYYDRTCKTFDLKNRCQWQHDIQNDPFQREQFMRLLMYYDTKKRSRQVRNSGKRRQKSFQKHFSILNNNQQSDVQIQQTQRNRFFHTLQILFPLRQIIKPKHSQKYPTVILNCAPNDTLALYFPETELNSCKITTEFQRPIDFISIEQQTDYLDNNQEFVFRYQMSQNTEYLIGLENGDMYSIRSMKKLWRKIAVKDDMPYINPFFDTIVNSVKCRIMAGMHTSSQTHQRAGVRQIWRFFEQIQILCLVKGHKRISQDNEQWYITCEILIVDQQNRKKRPSIDQTCSMKSSTKKNTARKTPYPSFRKPNKQSIYSTAQYKTFTFPIFQVQSISSSPTDIQWLSATQLLYTTNQDELYYAGFNHGLVQGKLRGIMLYLIARKIKRWSSLIRIIKLVVKLNQEEENRFEQSKNYIQQKEREKEAHKPMTLKKEKTKEEKAETTRKNWLKKLSTFPKQKKNSNIQISNGSKASYQKNDDIQI